VGTNLNPCSNCGQAISISAERCPHCGFTSGNCRICGLPISANDFYSHSSLHGYDDKKYKFHISCLNSHFQIPDSLTCRDCKTPLVTILQDKLSREYLSKHYHFPCPNCGCPDVLPISQVCGICGLGIYKDFQTKIVGRLNYFNNGTYAHNFSEKYHDFCHPSDSQLPEPLNKQTGCLSLAVLTVIIGYAVSYLCR